MNVLLFPPMYVSAATFSPHAILIFGLQGPFVYEEDKKKTRVQSVTTNKGTECYAKTTGRTQRTREGAKSVVGLLERMKCGRGIKDLDDESRGMEILMAEAFAKINPTDPLILGKHGG